MLSSGIIRSFPSLCSSLSSFRLFHTLNRLSVARTQHLSHSTCSNPSAIKPSISSLTINSSSLFPPISSLSCHSSVSSYCPVSRGFATARMKKAPTKKAGRKTKAIVKGTAKKGRPMKAKRGRTAKKKVGISKRPQLTEEQKALKKARTEKKKMALKHSEDRLKAQFIRSLQPQAKRAASPILQYISETVSKLREEKNLSPQEAVKEATKQYQALTDAQKQKYVKKFEQQKATLKEEWDKYEAKYGYPALPASGWLAYLNGRRAELVASNPSLGTKEKLTEVTQLVAAEWKKLSDSEKQNNKFFDHSKYEAAMKEYHEKKQKIDDKLLAQFNQWKEARAAKKEANKAKKQAAIPSS